MTNSININYYNTTILRGIQMKVIVHFKEKIKNTEEQSKSI